MLLTTHSCFNVPNLLSQILFCSGTDDDKMVNDLKRSIIQLCYRCGWYWYFWGLTLFVNGIKGMTMAMSKGSSGGKIIVRN